MNNTNYHFGRKFYAWLFVVGIATFAFHELAHWLAGTLLGYPMIIKPNHVYSLTKMLALHNVLTDAAGPVFSLFQAFAGFYLVKTRASKFGFSLLYMAFFMRLLATVVTLFNPNDEARLSVYLGLGQWPLPVLVCLGLFILTWSSSRYLELKWKDLLGCYAIASIAVSFVVGIDKFIFN
jgi:hypothetical protein